MSDLWCQKCSGFVLHPPCRCKPFQIKRTDKGYEGEEPETVYAIDPEYAAEKWAEEYDREGDYLILNGRDMTLHVTEPDGTEHTYEITGESVPTYHARERKAA